MARNNHPRERQARSLKRKKGTRPPYDRVLIVCEGSKTEPLYFNDIRQQNRVPTAHVTVMPSGYGTEPAQVVDFARDTFDETRAYEWVFAVFDRDAHRTYHDALQKAQGLDVKLKNDEKKKVRFIAVPSVPCFELWLLLHFIDIHAHLERDEAFQRLRGHIPAYAKGATGVYAATEAALPRATSRAQQLQQRFQPHTGTDPYTNVDLVVTLLQGIRAARP